MAKKKAAKQKLGARASEDVTSGHSAGGDSVLTYEAAVAEVESIVRKLESGDLDLTESLSQYELGIKRLKECHQILEAAEHKVRLLSGFDADGNPITEPMPETEFRSGAGKSPVAKSSSGKSATAKPSARRSKSATSSGAPDGGDDSLGSDSVDGEAGLF